MYVYILRLISMQLGSWYVCVIGAGLFPLNYSVSVLRADGPVAWCRGSQLTMWVDDVMVAGWCRSGLVSWQSVDDVMVAGWWSSGLVAWQSVDHVMVAGWCRSGLVSWQSVDDVMVAGWWSSGLVSWQSVDHVMVAGWWSSGLVSWQSVDHVMVTGWWSSGLVSWQSVDHVMVAGWFRHHCCSLCLKLYVIIVCICEFKVSFSMCMLISSDDWLRRLDLKD